MARNLYAKKLKIKELLKTIIERKIKEEYDDNIKAGFSVFRRQIPRRAQIGTFKDKREATFFRGH